MKRINGNRGSVTLLILWMIAILGVITAFLIYRSESEWAATVNLERQMRAERLAREILHEQMVLLTADDNEWDAVSEPWFNQNGIFQSERGGYQVTVTIEDEGSKPNLNTLSAEELAFFIEQGAGADVLLDWIDPDSELRNEGAERDYYQTQNPAYLPHDGSIASLNELLSLKDGKKLYEALAPHCTVYGKWNPNTLTRDEFENLLLSSGFDDRMAELIADDFAGYRATQRFDTLDQFLKLHSVTLQTLDKLKTLFEIKGHCNLNFVDEPGLKAILKKAGYDPKTADGLLARRAAAPFEALEEALPLLKNNTSKTKIKPEDFFTVQSEIFRIKIWLVREKRRFYLETVQWREASGSLASPWKIHVLSWNFLTHDLPDLPELKKQSEEETNESND